MCETPRGFAEFARIRFIGTKVLGGSVFQCKTAVYCFYLIHEYTDANKRGNPLPAEQAGPAGIFERSVPVRERERAQYA